MFTKVSFTAFGKVHPENVDSQPNQFTVSS